MRLDEPSWWYRTPASGVAKLLQPIAALWGWVAETRYRRGEAYHARLPVICIGNFTAGGTGKTPLVIDLCRRLRAIGHEPVVLSRGYGGRLTGPYWVDARRDTAREVGDEPLLLAAATPTLIARSRAAGARAIEQGPHPVSVIILDDGLQNPSLAKDFSIAVVSGTRGIGNERVMPAGPLRAPFAFQLELTDAIVVNEGTATEVSRVTEWLRHRFAGPVLRANVAPAAGTEWLSGMRVVAWAGIGAPERFFSLLAQLGAEVVRTQRFGDHQRLTDADAGRLLDEAQVQRATLVTTTKDMARLAGEEGALAELRRACRTLEIELRLVDEDAERLLALLAATLKPGVR